MEAELPLTQVYDQADYVRELEAKVALQGEELQRQARVDEFLREQNRLLIKLKRVLEGLLLNSDEEYDVLRRKYEPDLRAIVAEYFAWVVKMRADGHIVSN